ncbi:ABC-F family ATP-binding cassette domain-containing protein [Sphingobacterium deserti]|uniref:ABC transporter related protein n=1 Tax=Sphingobacterium deserti TaxID=1229276 RepID=A0A0B8T505_9SPHI|nr:ABC-F family ATP-binding cassette domain-containing protein [Sphingobacterium deserti]KGE12444.1 ABC transporter related protein [Sphingobacterium deserti]
MFVIQNLTYIHPDKETLFSNLSFSLSKFQKAALIGNNGTGKSTLLQLIAGKLPPSSGEVPTNGTIFFVPQLYGQFDSQTVAEVLGVSEKLNAYYAILSGKDDLTNFTILDDDWEVEERCLRALTHWGLTNVALTGFLSNLSGGEKVKVFLAAAWLSRPELLLMDEPSNHLDAIGKELLYRFIGEMNCTMLIVSHDRQLLNLFDSMVELSKAGITTFNGNYDHYKEQKESAHLALLNKIAGQEKEIRKAKDKERDTLERQQRADARGKKKQEKAGVARIMMNTLRNNAENSTSKLRSVHTERMEGLQQELTEMRTARPAGSTMRFGFAENALKHPGKALIEITELNLHIEDRDLWTAPLTFRLNMGERVAIQGANGSGKTTFAQMILGNFVATSGKIQRYPHNPFYIDQDYNLLDNRLSVYEQAQMVNDGAFLEHEVKTKLDQFLFSAECWSKQCGMLSGGERMRLALCCLTLHKATPDLLILDEPTNNLDIQNIEILTRAMQEYTGTLLVITHDQHFLRALHITRVVTL